MSDSVSPATPDPDDLLERASMWSQPIIAELAAEVESLRTQLGEMQRAYDVEHHGMGVEGSDFAEYGGTYHDKDGNLYAVAGSASATEPTPHVCQLCGQPFGAPFHAPVAGSETPTDGSDHE